MNRSSIRNLATALLLLSSSLQGSEFPWYDSEKQDYHKYSPEEIRKVIPQEREDQPGPLLRPPALPSLLFEIVFYSLLALLASYLLYLFWQQYRRFTPERKQGKTTIGLSATEETVEFATLTEKRSARQIRSLIEEAIADNALRKAASLIFLYPLTVLHETDRLVLQRAATVRDYNRQMQNLLPQMTDALDQSRQLFERAVYARQDPDQPVSPIWQSIQRGLEEVRA